jgi:hypothetical protein
VWRDTTTNITKVYDGTAWQAVDANNARALFDTDKDTGIQVEESSDEDIIRFDTAGAERMLINNSGDVGIGNTAPTEKLHVTGNARITGALKDSNNDSGTAGQMLSSTATGTDWVDSAAGIVVGQKLWELPHTSASSLVNNIGFTERVWNTIPFNSTPVIVNTTTGANGFTFNADGSVNLVAGKTYRIKLKLEAIYATLLYVIRIVDKNDSSNVLRSSSGDSGSYASTYPELDALVVIGATSDYVAQLYFHNGNGSVGFDQPQAILPSDMILPRVTITVEKLKD